MTFNSPDYSRIYLKDYNQSYTKVGLSKDIIKMIEDTDLLDMHEKLTILQLPTYTRMAVETGYELINKREKFKDGIYRIPKKHLDQHEEFLKKLPYPYTKVSVLRKGRNIDNAFEEEVLYMVCATDYIKNYINNYWQTFRDYEFGVIYGYPTTAILAYLKMIEPYPFLDYEMRANYSTCMQYIGCGIYSKLFFEKEKVYYEDIWRQIKEVSPKLAQLAEEEWEKEKLEIQKQKS